jgi:hypothetical protein
MRSALSIRAASRSSLSAAAVVAVAACASMDGELAAARESWRGATYEQVVMAWGTPSQSGKDSHTWLTDDSLPQAQRSGSGVGGVVFGAPSGTTARCDRMLAFRDGRVVEQRWSGDPGFCKRFARPAR